MGVVLGIVWTSIYILIALFVWRMYYIRRQKQFQIRYERDLEFLGSFFFAAAWPVAIVVWLICKAWG